MFGENTTPTVWGRCSAPSSLESKRAVEVGGKEGVVHHRRKLCESRPPPPAIGAWSNRTGRRGPFHGLLSLRVTEREVPARPCRCP